MQRKTENWGALVRELLIGSVFPALRKQKLYARANFMCCGSCAAYGLGQDMEAAALKGKAKDGAVYWHNQDDESLRQRGYVYLGFGAYEKGSLSGAAVGKLVADACTAAGLTVEWNGSEDERIHVVGPSVAVADVTVENHGSLMLFRPETDAGREWIDQHVDPDAMRWAGAVVVEPRYAGDLADGMVGDGLVVE